MLSPGMANGGILGKVWLNRIGRVHRLESVVSWLPSGTFQEARARRALRSHADILPSVRAALLTFGGQMTLKPGSPKTIREQILIL